MMGPRRRWLRLPVAAHIALALGVAMGAGAVAQQEPPCIPNVNCPTPPPATTAPPPAPTSEPEPTPEPSEPVPPPPDVLTTPEPAPEVVPESPVDAPLEEVELPPQLEETFQVPVLARTRPRNTVKLVGMLEPLAELGLPLEQVLVRGMGRFPVAGVAYYSDDWLNPRFTPEFHLHQGLDIFADFGTPIRAPDDGVVIRLSNGGAGGIGVWTSGTDGTHYYFAHLQSRVEGIHVGMPVKVGTVIGFVGDTGNAQGGAPHLHLQVHPGGGAPIPPKPTVDRWLDEAEAIAPQWVEAQRELITSRQRLLDGGGPNGDASSDLEATMLLTLLDPVGGSVGLLPRLEVRPALRPPFSDHLMEQLVRDRLHGYVLAPGAHGAHIRD